MGKTLGKILAAMAPGKPMSSRDLSRVTSLGKDQLHCGVARAWMGGYLFRTAEPICVYEESLRGEEAD